MAYVKNCELCRDKCLQAARAHEAAVGRMFVTKEFIALQKKIESGKLVEVVRCKDCEHYNGRICEFHSEWPDQYSTGHDAYMEPDDFCSYGEHKSGTQPQREE